IRIGENEKAVPEKLHLEAGILREHGLYAEFLCANDTDLVIFRRFLLGLNEFSPDTSGRSSCRGVSLALCDQLVLIFAKLAFNDFLHEINGYVHIIACLLRADDTAFDGDRDLDFLAPFLHAESYV